MAAPESLALRLAQRDFALENGRVLLLGADEACDLRLPHPRVAPHHATLATTAAGVLLAALVDDTQVNGLPTTRAQLRRGDIVRLGSVELRIVRDQGESEILPIPAMVAARRAAPAAPPQDGAPAAPPPRKARATAQGLPLRRAAEATFQDLMADELRRAPWFSLSVLAHAIVLLLLWWLLQAPPGGRDTVIVGVQLAGQGPLDAPPQATTATDRVTPEPPTPEPMAAASEDPDPFALLAQDLAPVTPTADDRRLLQLGSAVVMRPGGGSLPGGGGGSGEFRATVSDLRRTGLEIVFVLDSTGSMGGTIADAKGSAVEMLDVLRGLVPDARFGLVVFRDHGQREEYVTRVLPIGTDFWRLCNFTWIVDAGGGGDPPEAVYEALRAAFRQPWRPGARRVVVLAGDAPPHAETEAALLREVRAFAGDGRSHVHAILTERRARRPGRDPHDAAAAFQRIVEAGRGVCVQPAESQRVLQQVLTLAFGAKFEQDLAAVTRNLAERRAAGDPRDVALARRGGPGLRQALEQQPVRTSLVDALVANLRQAVARELIDLLRDPAAVESARHAAAYVLQRALELPAPPVDPLGGGVLDEGAGQAVLGVLHRLPR